MAIPINGAVHGLATRTAKKPVKKALILLLVKDMRPTRLANGLLMLTTSNNIKKMMTNTTIIILTKTGDWS